jgi:glycosyltransferase involved in cell wall biosynthesis
VRDPRKSDLALVIAHFGDEGLLKEAAEAGCKIIHRLDEYFEPHETGSRKEKHDKIVRLNAYAHVTVFQSQFVYNNVFPYLMPQNWRIILNGGDSKKFSPSMTPGDWIGHVSWGVADRKRLDLLRTFILQHPEERFLLVGRHAESGLDFALPNVKLVGKVRRWRIHWYYKRMKMLYFPSEKDPCPNTVIEAMLAGVPVCYNADGGTKELVAPCGGSPCGLPLDRAEELLTSLPSFRNNCLQRTDLYFDSVFAKYIEVFQ